MAKKFSLRKKEWDADEIEDDSTRNIIEGAIRKARSSTLMRDWLGVLIGGFFAIAVAYLHSASGKSDEKKNAKTSDSQE